MHSFVRVYSNTVLQFNTVRVHCSMLARRVLHLRAQNCVQVLVKRLPLIRVSTDAGVGHRRVQARVVRVDGTSVADIVGIAREGRVLLVAAVWSGRVRVDERRPSRGVVGRIPNARGPHRSHVHPACLLVRVLVQTSVCSLFSVFREQHTDAGVYDVPSIDTASNRRMATLHWVLSTSSRSCTGTCSSYCTQWSSSCSTRSSRSPLTGSCLTNIGLLSTRRHHW